MLKKLLILYIICSFQSILAQSKSSLLWEISGNGLSQPSYLYGTIHRVCKDNVNISPKFQNIIKQVDRLYLEINFDDIHNDFQAHFDSFNKSGKQLRTYFTKDEYATLERKFNKKYRNYKITLSQFSNYKPEEILPILLPKLIVCDWTSYEKEISRIAIKANKKIYGIETYQEHAAFEDNSDTTISSQAHRFYNLISEKEAQNEAIEAYNKLFNVYQSKDVEQLYLTSIEKQSREEAYKLLDVRNKLWIPRIAKISKENTALYAVGAAHLGGENGVISLLRKEGFILKPILD